LIQRTHIYQFHAAHAKIFEFAGFEMPLWYRGTREECLAVRNQVGIFDVSHMGRILISGEEAEAFLNFVTTNDVSALRESQGHYSLMCNESGGIKDDLVLTRISGLEFILVYNATNRISDFEWLSKNTSGFKVKLENVGYEPIKCSAILLY
jgi:glycine cleavage system aminomethyltransferase T